MTTWKRRASAGVLLEVLLVLGPGGRRDGAQLAAGQRRLEQVGRVALPGLPAGADHGVRLVDEQDDRRGRGLDLVDHRLQPVLELALHAGTGLQQRQVERADGHVAQRRRHVALGDPQREALDHRGLADAGLAGQDRVVLAPPGQDVDDLPDLGIAAQHRVDLAALGGRVRSTVNWSSAGVLLALPGTPSAPHRAGLLQRHLLGTLFGSRR